ncbi:ABC transporter substrate-binding protein [Fertoeibacter niger]
MTRKALALCALALPSSLLPATTAQAQTAPAQIEVPITYLRQEVELPPTLSNLDPVPEDLGIVGAEVALADNATTGGFLGHDYTLDIVSVAPGDDLLAAAGAALAASGLLLVEAGAPDLLRIADLPAAADALIFNVAAGDRALRDADCRANLLHTLPEDAMRTDALMQVLQAKRFADLVMITGPQPGDASYAEALRRSATKFGLTILAEKPWTFDTDLRRAAPAEVPLFTQDFPDHHILLIADEADDFGRYVEHNTWLPRPIAGSEGLEGLGWAPVVEQWGAVQLQNRFEKQAGRDMASRDYAAWAAVRAIGEAVTRTNAADPAALRAYMLSDAFALDGFKGRPLTFRTWNGQLRQPIPVVNARALVQLAPVEGFLHQSNELDSLGVDAPESTCTAFGGTP